MGWPCSRWSSNALSSCAGVITCSFSSTSPSRGGGKGRRRRCSRCRAPRQGARGGTAAGERVMLSVSDTGEGMNDEILHRAMEPFFTTRDPFQRPGLGLSTVHGIASRWGGHLELQSQPAVGTTASITLPAWSPPAELVAQGTPHPNGARTILVVEDEDAVRSVVMRTLDEENAGVVGRYALEADRRLGAPRVLDPKTIELIAIAAATARISNLW